MRTPTRKQKPRKAQVTSFPAPTGGLISNRNLAISNGEGMPPGAAVLENYFPTATGVMVRRGSETHETLTGGAIKSMFNYIAGNQREFFAATDDGVWDVTSGKTSVLSGTTSGDWTVVQYATAGGAFLIGVNGADDAFLYDGTTFDATTITFPSGSSLTTADLSYVWVYKQRIWFIEKDSLNAWYLPVDQVGGELTLWPMGGIFVRGGVLLWGQGWSLDSGGAGGLSEQCVFTTTEGQVAAYQGLSPEPDQGWSHVGTYRVGRPMGKNAFIRAGGDIVIASSVGFVSLSAASQQDYAALGQGAISYPIEDDWSTAVLDRGQVDWRCQVWADGQMAFVSPPVSEGQDPILFVSNTNTGRWGIFTGWDARALGEFQGGLYFGTEDGDVKRGWVTGEDDGVPYVARCLPLFSDLGAPASVKVAKMARAIIKAAIAINPRLSGQSDYEVTFPAAPSLGNVPSGSEWDVGEWDDAKWDANRDDVVSSKWVPIGAHGHDLSVGVQITSGAILPNDAELIRVDLMYTFGDAGT